MDNGVIDEFGNGVVFGSEEEMFNSVPPYSEIAKVRETTLKVSVGLTLEEVAYYGVTNDY